jgi:hypothetical protein
MSCRREKESVLMVEHGGAREIREFRDQSRFQFVSIFGGGKQFPRSH